MIIYEEGEQFNVPPKWLADHDKQIRDDVIEEFRKYYMKGYEGEKKMGMIFDFALDILKELEQKKGEQNEVRNN